MVIERREFLRMLGGAAGVAVAAGFGLNQVVDVPEELIERARFGPGIESWKNTVCGMCPAGCGLRIRQVDDIPVYVRGNPDFPATFGGMCPVGHASLEALFNPDRVHQPLRRLGPPGAGRFEVAGWEESLEIISSRLRTLRSEGRSHEVAFLGTPDGMVTETVIRRFMRAYGSPNVFLRPELLQAGVPYLLTEGTADLPAYDLLEARTVLSIGSNFLEEEHAPVQYTRLFTQETGGARRSLIYAAPRMDITGAKADVWIPVRPGTYAALALGIAHVLIREELYDADFVREHTYGFDDWTDRDGIVRPGYRTMVLDDYFPERVSGITGVPSDTILSVARQLGIDRPSVVIGGSGVGRSVQGTLGTMAVHGLNALLGSFEVPGGVYRADVAPLAGLPPLTVDPIAESGLSRPSVGSDAGLPVSGFSIETLTENLLAGRPYPVQVLFLLGENPVFDSISHHDFVEALGRIPLVVSFDSFVTETTEYADIVLPDHTFLEKWDLTTGIPSVGTTHVGVRRPVVEPFFDTRQAGEVLGELARSVAPSLSAVLPTRSIEDAVKRMAQGLYESGSGAVASADVRGAWLRYLRERGWHMGRYADFESFWRELLEHGGWWNPVRETRTGPVFDTPSGRFEFLSQVLATRLTARTDAIGPSARLAEMGFTARDPVAFMPHHEDDTDPDGHSLHLVVFGSLTSRGGNAANLPMMQEQFGMAARRPWRTWVEINPATARDHDIGDGDWVRLESSIGTLRAQARLVPSTSPDVVAVPFGQGHTSFGRYASGVGANPHSIVRARYDRISGTPAVQSTGVTIHRIA